MMIEQVQIKGKLGYLRGVVHKPILSSRGIVILTHGYFTSTKLGPENLYVQIARIFAKRGYEFWRFHSYGVGDSDGDFHVSTYDLRITDYKTIAELALKQHDNVLILGHSIGTSIAVYLANTYSQNIKTLFLLSPTFGKLTYVDNLFSKEMQKQLQENGFTFRRTQLINKGFIEQMTSEKIYQDIQKCKAKFFLFFPKDDEFYDKMAIERAISHMKNYALIEIEEGGHNFLKDRTVLFENITLIINGL